MPGINRQGKGTRKNKKGRRKMWREELWKGPPEQQDWSRAGGAGMRPRITYASEAPTRTGGSGLEHYSTAPGETVRCRQQ